MLNCKMSLFLLPNNIRLQINFFHILIHKDLASFFLVYLGFFGIISHYTSIAIVCCNSQTSLVFQGCRPCHPFQLLLCCIICILSPVHWVALVLCQLTTQKNGWIVTVWRRMCIHILIQLEEHFTILHSQEFTNNCFPTILLPATKCRHKFLMRH